MREDRPALCRRERRSPGVPAPALRTGTDRTGTQGGRAAAQGRPVPAAQDAGGVRLRRPALASTSRCVLQLVKGDTSTSGRTCCSSALSGTGKTHLATALGMAACAKAQGPVLPGHRTDHTALGSQRGAAALADAEATWQARSAGPR